MPSASLAEDIAATFGPKTKGKILTASLALFNADGFDRVRTAQIAEAADVLEGTLWYHFKAKQNLVLAHLDALERVLEMHFERPLGESGPQIAGYVVRGFQILWDFRYLLRDPLRTLLEEPTFPVRLQRTYERLEEKIQERLQAAADQGLLDLSKADRRALAISCILVGRHWPDYARIRHADDPDPDRDHRRGLYQLVTLLRPYYTKKAHRLFEGLDPATLA